MKPSDKVTWTKITKRGKRVTMKHMEGEIIKINNIAGEALVKYGGNHQRTIIAVEDLRPVGEKGQLTEFVELMAMAVRK